MNVYVLFTASLAKQESRHAVSGMTEMRKTESDRGPTGHIHHINLFARRYRTRKRHHTREGLVKRIAVVLTVCRAAAFYPARLAARIEPVVARRIE